MKQGSETQNCSKVEGPIKLEKAFEVSGNLQR